MSVTNINPAQCEIRKGIRFFVAKNISAVKILKIFDGYGSIMSDAKVGQSSFLSRGMNQHSHVEEHSCELSLIK